MHKKCNRLIVMAFSLIISTFALAEGTETLGTPGIDIASGTGVVAAGVGLQDSQPGNIEITVPAGIIKQVLVYWGGNNRY